MRTASTLNSISPCSLRSLEVTHQQFLGLQLLHLGRVLDRALEHIVLEVAFFDAAVGELHLANAILDAVLPFALVA